MTSIPQGILIFFLNDISNFDIAQGIYLLKRRGGKNLHTFQIKTYRTQKLSGQTKSSVSNWEKIPCLSCCPQHFNFQWHTLSSRKRLLGVHTYLFRNTCIQWVTTGRPHHWRGWQTFLQFPKTLYVQQSGDGIGSGQVVIVTLLA